MSRLCCQITYFSNNVRSSFSIKSPTVKSQKCFIIVKKVLCGLIILVCQPHLQSLVSAFPFNPENFPKNNIHTSFKECKLLISKKPGAVLSCSLKLATHDSDVNDGHRTKPQKNLNIFCMPGVHSILSGCGLKYHGIQISPFFLREKLRIKGQRYDLITELWVLWSLSRYKPCDFPVL